MIYVDHLKFFSPSQIGMRTEAHSTPSFTGEKGEGKRLICDLHNDGAHIYARILGEENVLAFVRLPFKEFRIKEIYPGSYNEQNLFFVPEASKLIFRMYGHVDGMAVGFIGIEKESKLIWFRRFCLQKGRMLRVRERGDGRKFVRLEEYLLG
jgi:hypothetical protein